MASGLNAFLQDSDEVTTSTGAGNFVQDSKYYHHLSDSTLNNKEQAHLLGAFFSDSKEVRFGQKSKAADVPTLTSSSSSETTSVARVIVQDSKEVRFGHKSKAADVPTFTSSSSIETTKPIEAGEQCNESSWTEKLHSQCNMETACANINVEFMKKEESKQTTPTTPSLRFKGEPLLLEEGEKPQRGSQISWTRVSKTAIALAQSLGFVNSKISVTKQRLITDYYKPKDESWTKTLSLLFNKSAQVYSRLSGSALQLIFVEHYTKQKKGKRQTLITEFDKGKRQTLITEFDPRKIRGLRGYHL